MRYINRVNDRILFEEVDTFEIAHLQEGIWSVYTRKEPAQSIDQLQLVESFEDESTAKLFLSFLERWQRQGASVSFFHSSNPASNLEGDNHPDQQGDRQRLRDQLETKCNLSISYDDDEVFTFIVIVDGKLTFERLEKPT
ncbi:MAG TPA: hypothetical protein PLO74_04885 [Thermotogota bacterium]|mgnify:FL=1|jgi:hypothetical protein|nr:hypothetical protein [Thermotogota bacterium]